MLIANPYSSALFQELKFIKSRYKNIYFVLKSQEKNTEYGVHLALVKMGTVGKLS
jgi:hypothetical protein